MRGRMRIEASWAMRGCKSKASQMPECMPFVLLRFSRRLTRGELHILLLGVGMLVWFAWPCENGGKGGRRWRQCPSASVWPIKTSSIKVPQCLVCEQGHCSETRTRDAPAGRIRCSLAVSVLLEAGLVSLWPRTKRRVGPTIQRLSAWSNPRPVTLPPPRRGACRV